MSKDNAGGSAFPQNTKIMLPAGQEIHQGFMGGMTLRDYFAAKAMQAIMIPNPVTGQYAHHSEFDACSVSAYQMADAMLKARGK